VRIILLIFFLFSSGCALSQHHYRFLQFNADNGLSQNSVHAIFRDRDGLMWIGTQDGLNSFDGKNFTIYKPRINDSSSISDQFILSIIEDSNGFLWVGTRHGLNKLDKRTGKFRRFFVSENEQTVFQSTYESIYQGEKNRLIFLQNKRLYCIDVTTGKIESLMQKGLTGYVFVDRDLALWNFNAEKGVFKIKSNPSSTPEKVSGSFPEFSPYIFGIGKNYFAFVSWDKKIVVYDKTKLQWLPALELADQINCLYFNDNDILFAGTQRGIDVIKENKVIQHIEHDPLQEGSLPPGPVLSIYEDKDHNLWAGTVSSGFVLHGQNFGNTEIIKASDQNKAVHNVAEDNNYIWMGNATGLYRYDKNNSAVLSIPIFSGKNITALASDINGNLWAGVNEEGLWNIDKTGRLLKKFTIKNSPLATMQIQYLVSNRDGNLHISGKRGFYCYNIFNGKWKAITNPGLPSKIISNYILHSYTDSEKNIWLSSNNGVIVYDNDFNFKKIIASYADSTPIKRTLITCITQDNPGNFWIGTVSKGVYKLDKLGALKNFNTGSGLASDVITSLTTDNKGRIWAATSDGLYVYDTGFHQFFRLTPFDGVPQAAFSNGSIYKSISGKIYLGSSAGLLIFNANSIKLSNRNITAKITDIKVNGTSTPRLQSPFNINAYNKTISFQFGTSEAFQFGNIIYQYKLDGVDKEWQTLPAGSNSISYNNLPYKRLTMQLRAAQSFIAMEKAPITHFTINSTAPFWKTEWFIALSLIAVTGLALYVLQQYNNRKYEKQRQQIKEQEQLQNERERIAQDLHDNIGAYAAALITGLGRMEDETGEAANNITDLKDHASSILLNLRETIWVLHQPSLTVQAFAERFKNYVFKISKQYPDIDIGITEEIQVNKELSPRIALNVFRILQEALQNVFKHAAASKADIGFFSNEKLIFYVKDNGKGITQKAKNDSYGLKNMQARASDIGFSFHIDTSPGNGTGIELIQNTANAAVAVSG